MTTAAIALSRSVEPKFPCAASSRALSRIPARPARPPLITNASVTVFSIRSPTSLDAPP